MEYGCIGEKLTHSFSKIIHKELADYDYTLKEIAKEDLPEFLKTADFKAINVTIPYKQAVIPYLHYVSDTAKKIGAVNTIVNRDGKLYGYNTDFSGLKALIERNNISLEHKKVLILGSGGTSKTASVVAETMKADSVFRVSRSGNDGAITYEEAYKNHTDANIIINTTPVGMYPNLGGMAVDLDKFGGLEAVVDAVYNPLCSELVVTAKAKGIKAVGGLYMLVSQAVFAVEKFLNININPQKTESVYKSILKSKKNIVLIGMPSSGKTTIGKRVAEELNMQFSDTDEEIVKFKGKTIPEIFNCEGEIGFRKTETEVIKKASACQNTVIATGGGAVLNPENIKLLKQNGMVIFIDRPLEDLITTDDRPLSSNRELLEKRYEERYDIYNASADRIIKAEKQIEKNIKAIKEVFLNEIVSD